MLKKLLIKEHVDMMQEIDKVARLWEKNGINNLERRTISTDSSHKTDDGWNSVDKQRRLF